MPTTKPKTRRRRALPKKLARPRSPWDARTAARVKAELAEAGEWAADLVAGETTLADLSIRTGLHHSTLLRRMQSVWTLDPAAAAEHRGTVAGILSQLFLTNLFAFHQRIHHPLSVTLCDKDGNETIEADMEDRAIAVRGFALAGEFLRKLCGLGAETIRTEGPVKEREPLLLEELATLSKLSPELEASLKQAMVTSVKTLRRK